MIDTTTTKGWGIGNETLLSLPQEYARNRPEWPIRNMYHLVLWLNPFHLKQRWTVSRLRHSRTAWKLHLWKSCSGWSVFKMPLVFRRHLRLGGSLWGRLLVALLLNLMKPGSLLWTNTGGVESSTEMACIAHSFLPTYFWLGVLKRSCKWATVVRSTNQ